MRIISTTESTDKCEKKKITNCYAPGGYQQKCPAIGTVLYPGKGECADRVNEDAILEKEGGGEPQDRNGERQLASDTGEGKT